MKYSKEIPDWFDLKNYDVLYELESTELAFQLAERIHLFEQEFPLSKDNFKLSLLCQDKVIITLDQAYGEKTDKEVPPQPTVVDDPKLQKALAVGDSLNLPMSASVIPLSVIMAKHHGNIASQHYPSMLDQPIHEFVEEMQTSFDLVFGNTSPIPGQIPLNLTFDLTNDDETILKELRSLLPAYRHKLKIEDPAINRQLAHKKALNYRVIPFLDLNIWAKQNDLKITDETLATVLFPEGHRDAYFIRSTLKNFLYQVSESNYCKDPFAFN